LPILQAVIQQESGWNASAPAHTNSNGTTDYGIAQLNNQYYPNAASMSANDEIATAAQTLATNYKNTGSWTAAVAAYNGSGSAASDYANKVIGLANQLGLDTGSTGTWSSGGSNTGGVTGAVNSAIGTLGSNISSWLSSHLIALGVGLAAVLLIIFSFTNLFSDQIESAAKFGAKVAAVAA
jgi:hypothetical protein